MDVHVWVWICVYGCVCVGVLVWAVMSVFDELMSDNAALFPVTQTELAVIVSYDLQCLHI